MACGNICQEYYKICEPCKRVSHVDQIAVENMDSFFLQQQLEATKRVISERESQGLCCSKSAKLLAQLEAEMQKRIDASKRMS